ncbi:MAG: hypothetical protein KF709_14825 [Gemmatimonadaceae bacterium]|nr:hypothetical protein [Gemmatimonadaceae bacterium]
MPGRSRLRLGALILGLAMPGVIDAQWGDLRPWYSFAGCWSDPAAGGQGTTLCVIPTDGDPFSADLITLSNGLEVSSSRVRADGTQRPFTTESCAGTETARFSNGGLRVYLLGSVRCGESGATSRSSALFSVSETGRLVYVFGVDDPTRPSAGLLQLSPLDPREMPRRLRDALQPVGARFNLHREALALKTLSLADVVDVGSAANPTVTELWAAAMIASSSEGLIISARQRDSLEADGWPARLSMLLYALSEPFAYDVYFSPAGARVQAITDGAAAIEYTRAIARLVEAGRAHRTNLDAQSGDGSAEICGLVLLPAGGAVAGFPLPPMVLPSDHLAVGASVRCASPMFVAHADQLNALYAAAPSVLGVEFEDGAGATAQQRRRTTMGGQRPSVGTSFTPGRDSLRAVPRERTAPPSTRPSTTTTSPPPPPPATPPPPAPQPTPKSPTRRP